jgi:hypothetical protein
MHPADLELLADLIADRLRAGAPDPRALADVKTVAAALGVSTDFVREHAQELGGFRITDSPRAPWRFSVDQARERFASRTGERSDPPAAGDRGRRRPPSKRAPKRPAGRVLAIRGPGA